MVKLVKGHMQEHALVTHLSSILLVFLMAALEIFTSVGGL